MDWFHSCVRSNLFTLAIEVDEGVAGGRDVLRCHSLVHAVDIEVETTVGVHQQTQHRPLWTRIQVRTVVLTYLKRGKRKREKREKEDQCIREACVGEDDALGLFI